uniref:Rho-GAP domain-containing protein n=1 Tax=Parascaris equorum TaxID=6256 RepID=A0A914SH29_PAREQ
MDRMVADRADGIDIARLQEQKCPMVAFFSTPTWSKYCKELLNFVSRRVQLELDHAKKKRLLTCLCLRTYKMSEKEVWEFLPDCLLETEGVLYSPLKCIFKCMQQYHFLPLRDVFESSFDNDVAFCEQTYDAVKHIQDRFIKSLEMRRDDHERQRRALKSEWMRVTKQVPCDMYRFDNVVEELLSFGLRVAGEEAQSQVEKLEGELERREQFMEDTKVRIVGQLRELALANLWVSLPGKYHEFADATRTYTPGAEYMAENEEGLSSANNTASSSSVSSQRRNAIDVLDHEMLPERKPKKSSARLLEQSTLEGTHTEAAKSHRLQRIRQPTKCAHCEALSILSTVQCTQCSMVWHKSCLTRVSVFCGQSSKALSDCARRMSIFGVPLKGHLDGQHRKVPLILEKCVDELQRRGLKVKGIYRTCGVKSKIEHICEEFERSPSCVDVDLSVFHPMNIASVVKLYLRKLPEPLLTQELYNEWISLAGKNIKGEGLCVVEQIRNLLQKFEVDNLMTASNLGAVISPSMIWVHPATPSCSSSSFLSDAHLMSKARSNGTTNVLDDLLDDDADVVCTPFMPQPPTPDLLKNTSRGKNESCKLEFFLDLSNSVLCSFD